MTKLRTVFLVPTPLYSDLLPAHWLLTCWFPSSALPGDLDFPASGLFPLGRLSHSQGFCGQLSTWFRFSWPLTS